ncbi:MAG: 4Fe-4S binding protein [Desulfocucumaceae bacterium]
MQKQLNGPMTSCGPGKEKKALYGPVATVFISTKTGAWRIVRPVVDQERCSLCGTCQKYCPTDVVQLNREEAGGGVSFDFDYCKGCGICANVCPRKCVTMEPEGGERL